MRWGVIALVLIASATAPAQEIRTFDQPFIAPDGSRRVAQIGTVDEEILDPHPALVRRADYDSLNSTLDTGAFPVPARGDEEPVELRVVVDIDAAGKPVTCSMLRPSGQPAFDAHACPHLMQHLRHTPALDWQGKRTTDRLAMRVRYYFMVIPVAPPAIRMMPSAISRESRPVPVRPIDAAGAGLTGRDVPGRVTGVSGGLKVEADGRVSACTLVGATRVDTVDLRICQRLRDWPFTPAVDRAGRPIAARYSFRVTR